MAALAISSFTRTPINGLYGEFLFEVTMSDDIPTADGGYVPAKATGCRRVTKVLGTSLPASNLIEAGHANSVSSRANVQAVIAGGAELGAIALKATSTAFSNAVVRFIGR